MPPNDMTSTQADVSLGKAIYNAKCAACHGEDGSGDGVEAALLFPKPRNHTSGVYKFRSTESGSIPTDDDLAGTISNGLQGTSMPAWKKWIAGDSLNAVIAYIKSFSPKFQSEKPNVVRVAASLPASAASIARGRTVYEKLQCASCHGADGKGTNAIATDLRDTWDNPIAATDLTEPWNFRGGATAWDVCLRFRTGIDGTPMPSYVGSASDEEMWHLANYVLSLARKPTWNMNTDELMKFYSSLEDSDRKNPLKRGEYLVKSTGCADCHSPVEENGKHISQLLFAGGQRWSFGAYGDIVTPNLTSDKETGLGNLSDEQIMNALTKGIRHDGSRMLPFPMPWTSYAAMKAEDLKAIITYLRTIPPVYNRIPEPQSRNIFSYLWAKFKMLILKEDLPGFVYPGNAGQTKSQPVTQAQEGRR
jgi:cytochrome c oxidase cbb3-type subunit 2